MATHLPFLRLGNISRWSGVTAQLSLVVIGLAALSLWPPRDGPLLLIAIDGRDAGFLVAPALRAGATPIARGPLANMLIVTGTRGKRSDLARQGIFTLAAPSTFCGKSMDN